MRGLDVYERCWIAREASVRGGVMDGGQIDFPALREPTRTNSAAQEAWRGMEKAAALERALAAPPYARMTRVRVGVGAPMRGVGEAEKPGKTMSMICRSQTAPFLERLLPS